VRRAARTRLSTALLLAPPLAFLTLLFALPLGRVLYGSVFAPDFTLAHYTRMWTVPVYARVFWITLKISTLTTVGCVLLGYLAAYFLATVRPRTRQLLLLGVIVPFFLSVLVRNYIWMILLQKTGLLNQALARLGLVREPLDLMYNETGVLIAMVNMLLPYVIFPVLSSLLAIPPELRQASASLGAGAARTFWRVTLPLSLPGVAAGGLLVFIVALGFFITPALLGGPKQMMISNLIAYFISYKLQRQPIYEALAHQDGIHLPNNKERSGSGRRTVALIMRGVTEFLPAEMSVQQAVESVRASKFRAWPVMDQGNIVGVLARSMLESANGDGRKEQAVLGLVETLEFPHVHADHALHLALERMSQSRIDILPVVNRADVHKLEGIVTLRDVLDAYGVDSQGSA